MAEASQLFPITRWTLLQALRDGTEEESKMALETLCQAYWMPLYIVARKRGMSNHDAEDAVQGFFLWMMKNESLEAADQNLGMLRAFLLKLFENYRSHLWRRQSTLKRGAGIFHDSYIDLSHAEEHFLQIASKEVDIEKLYTQEWARRLLERGLAALRQKYEKAGLTQRFELLIPHLMNEEAKNSAQQDAMAAGMSYTNFRQALHRLRLHYREKLEHELALTLGSSDPEIIHQEMLELFRSFETA